MTMSRKVGRLLIGMLAALPLMSRADSTITVKVTVLAPPPCTINNDRPIEVIFGDVMTTSVDGNNYRMPVNYTLLCTGGSHNAMKLQIQGNGAPFNNTLLQTDKTGLAIELQQEGSKLAVNNWVNFTYPNKPVLWAVPVKQSGVTLTGGEFSASATMKVDYQ